MCGQLMNGRGGRSERNSSSSDSNKVCNIGCSLAVNPDTAKLPGIISRPA